MTTTDDDVPGDGELRRLHDRLARVDGEAALHPTDDDWVAYAEGTLAGEARERFADHVVRCAACADAFRAVNLVREGATSVMATGGRAPGGSPVAFGVRQALAMAAVLALVIAGAVWLRTSPSPGASRPAVAAGGDTPAPPIPAGGPDAPVPRGWAVVSPAPAVMLPAALTLTMRGAPPEAEGFLTAFGAAITPYRDGRLAEAAVALATVTARYPHIPEGWYYLGVALLLSGDPAAAIDPLQRATDSSVAGDDAAWLAAVALERSGRSDDATAALTTLCQSERTTSRRACDATGAAR